MNEILLKLLKECFDCSEMLENYEKDKTWKKKIVFHSWLLNEEIHSVVTEMFERRLSFQHSSG